MEPFVDRPSVLELLRELVETESVSPSLDPDGADEWVSVDSVIGVAEALTRTAIRYCNGDDDEGP